MPLLPSRARTAGLTALLFVSGFCGISYEVLYARLLGNLLGDQFAVRAAVLLTFLLGIGAGTIGAYRLWRHLWLVEAAIGAYAVAFAAALPAIDRLLYTHVAAASTQTAVQLAISAALLAVPALLIGCTLPLFAGYLAALRPGRAFPTAYALYNLGAAATALLIEFWLLRQLGLTRAVLAIAGLNLAVAAIVRLGFGPLRNQAPGPEEGARPPGRIVAALALLGVGSAVFQLLLIKLVECLFGPFHETFAYVLGIVLLGIALGAGAARRWSPSFGTVAAVALVGLAWLTAGYGLVARAYAALYEPAVADPGPLGPVLLKLGILAVLGLVPATAFGATIPALLTHERHVARESGYYLAVASLANAAGFLLMAFVLHAWLDYGGILLVVAALTAAGLALSGERPRPGRLAWAAGLLAVCLGARVAIWDETLLLLGFEKFRDPAKLAQARARWGRAERFGGHEDTFAITWLDGKPYFFINGYVSFALESVNERVVGALGALFSPRTDRALVLGLGSGVTAATVGLVFSQTDAVEINPAVVANLDRMKRYNFDITRISAVRPIVDDGIHFVKAGDGTYSLILNTVTSPLYFSSSKLYTREFLAAVRRRLTPDGLYVTWVDSRVGDRGMDIICRTVRQTFSHVGLCAITSSYYLLLASNAPLGLRHPDAVAAQPVLGPYFRAKGLDPTRLPYSLMTSDISPLLAPDGGAINTIDMPILEFEMARLRNRGIAAFKRRLRDHLSYADIARALGPGRAADRAAQTGFLQTLLEDSTLVRRWSDLAGR